MGEITRTIPKPLIPVCGRPAVEHVIAGLREQGFVEIVLVIGYLGEQVRRALGDGRNLGVSIQYVEQTIQDGTASALLLARQCIGKQDILLTFADILMEPENYGRLRETFYADRCGIVGGVRRVDDPHRGAAVYLDSQDNILRIIEKPPPGTSATPWNHAGIYCFSNVVLNYLEKVEVSSRGEYEVTDAAAAMIADNYIAKGIELVGYWRDLATPEDVLEAEAFLGC